MLNQQDSDDSLHNALTVSVLEQGSFNNIKAELTSKTMTELCQIILTQRWCPATYTLPIRNKENAKQMQLFALDIDEGCSLDKALELFKDYWHIIGTTKSHQKYKGEGDAAVLADRFRVILLLESPVFKDSDCKRVFKLLYKEFPFIDAACKDISRYFEPCVDIVSTHNEPLFGLVTGWEDIPEEVEREIVEVEASEFKGKLYADTMDFLLRGKPHGQRNNAVFSAAKNMQEQGYSQDEVIELIESAGSRNHMPTLSPMSKKHLAAVERAFRTPATNPLQDVLVIPEEPKLSISAKDLLQDAFTYLEDKEALKGDSSGFSGLNTLLGGGFRGGELTVLHAPGGSGKSTFFHQLQYNMLTAGIPQAYASREMRPTQEVLPHYYSMILKKNVWTQDITEEEKKVLAKVMGEWNLEFAPGYGALLLEELQTWMDHLLDRGFRHFWFDHLHYMVEDEDYKLANRMARFLKEYTIKNNVHVHLIVQPTKIGPDQKLGPNTLKGGSGIHQAMDNFLVLDSEQPANASEKIKNCSRIRLMKGRSKMASLGTVFYSFNQVDKSFQEMKVVEGEEEAPQAPDRRVQDYEKFERNLNNSGDSWKKFKPYFNN